MSNVIAWRAYYDTGVVLDSELTTWAALPATGLIIIMLYFDEVDKDSGVRYRRILEGSDWYFQTQRPETSPDRSGYDQSDGATPRVDSRDPKMGKLVTDEQFAAIEARALGDLKEPEKAPITPSPAITPTLFSASRTAAGAWNTFTLAVTTVQGWFR